MRNNLRTLRLLNDITQAELSKSTQIHYSTVSRIENGIVKPTAKQMQIISEFFHMNEEEIFPRE